LSSLRLLFTDGFEDRANRVRSPSRAQVSHFRGRQHPFLMKGFSPGTRRRSMPHKGIILLAASLLVLTGGTDLRAGSADSDAGTHSTPSSAEIGTLSDSLFSCGSDVTSLEIAPQVGSQLSIEPREVSSCPYTACYQAAQACKRDCGPGGFCFPFCNPSDICSTPCYCEPC
jgi:hypothetical protein